jgi:hypothetical protein
MARELIHEGNKPEYNKITNQRSGEYQNRINDNLLNFIKSLPGETSLSPEEYVKYSFFLYLLAFRGVSAHTVNPSFTSPSLPHNPAGITPQVNSFSNTTCAVSSQHPTAYSTNPVSSASSYSISTLFNTKNQNPSRNKRKNQNPVQSPLVEGNPLVPLVKKFSTLLQQKKINEARLLLTEFKEDLNTIEFYYNGHRFRFANWAAAFLPLESIQFLAEEAKLSFDIITPDKKEYGYTANFSPLMTKLYMLNTACITHKDFGRVNDVSEITELKEELKIAYYLMTISKATLREGVDATHSPLSILLQLKWYEGAEFLMKHGANPSVLSATENKTCIQILLEHSDEKYRHLAYYWSTKNFDSLFQYTTHLIQKGEVEGLMRLKEEGVPLEEFIGLHSDSTPYNLFMYAADKGTFSSMRFFLRNYPHEKLQVKHK